MPHGGSIYRSANLPIENHGNAEAANLLKVSPRTVKTAMAASGIANMQVGNPDFSYSANLQNREDRTRAEAADLLKVSERE